jgi:hypothetical protein
MRSPCCLCVCAGTYPVYITLGHTAEIAPPPTVGRIIFYVVDVVSKENKPLVLPRTSCFPVWIMEYLGEVVISESSSIS